MTKLRKLPVGIESFDEIIREKYYYVDKTGLLEQILERCGKANLFTRPRRFGKSLNMSMLKSFFEIGADKTLFDGLYISTKKELCEAYQAKYPVVCISLKGVNADTYENAYGMLAGIITEEATRLEFLLESEKLTQTEKRQFEKLLDDDIQPNTLTSSVRRMTAFLEKHYGEKVIVLIDEYDVPLAKANENGYYDKMVLLVRNLFENTLKTNESLKFAVLTGCLRIAKESIFTGLNNFKVYSITDVAFDEYFGFTDAEVKDLLHYYGKEECYETVKAWYDGYRFGNVDVYCPWDVMNYCADCLYEPNLAPKNYWLNTSGNSIIHHFIDSMGEEQKLTKTELEHLIAGDIVQKEINQELTYKELYASIDNLWSALFMTGYLTQRSAPSANRYNLVIPNREIRNIITEHVLILFKKEVKKDGNMVRAFCDALLEGNPQKVEQLFTAYMNKTISIRDTFVKNPTKENFYHGLLLGILSFKGGWMVTSNQESGDGYSDIMVRIDDVDVGIIIEVKYAPRAEMEAESKRALCQINEKRYAEIFRQAEIERILKYGIACNRKSCKVALETESD